MVVAAGVALALTGCGGGLGLPEPATDQAETVVDLWRALLVAAGLLGLVVVGLATFALLRYRDRSGTSHDERPPDTGRGHTLLEAVYVTIPLAVVAGFFAYTLWVDDLTTELADDPDVVVDVTGYRWGWRFAYPEEGVTVASVPGERPLLVLPAGATVRLRLRSDDVIHSFFVPAFLTKRDLLPGQTSVIDVDVQRTGDFEAHCAEYCGLYHAQMNFVVRVVEEDAYERWLDGVARDAT